MEAAAVKIDVDSFGTLEREISNLGAAHAAEEKRRANFRAWWASLTPEMQRAEIRAGHVAVRLSNPYPKCLTKNQRKAMRRKARA